jgi:hypothetical protein
VTSNVKNARRGPISRFQADFFSSDRPKRGEKSVFSFLAPFSAFLLHNFPKNAKLLKIFLDLLLRVG